MALSTVNDMLTQCPICLEDYTMPRALPCLHTFCEKCLVDWIKLKNTEAGLRVHGFGTFACPVCKEQFKLPPQGITGFKHNFYIASFAVSDITRRNSVPDGVGNGKLEKDITCQRCEEQGVAKICLKCATWLCPYCCDDHERVRSTKGHILVSHDELLNASVPDVVNLSDLGACQNDCFEAEGLKFFCITCKQLICENCQLEKHQAQNHDLLSVISNIDNIRKQMLDCLSSLNERSGIYRAQHSDLVRYKKNVNRRYHTAQKIIFKTVDMLQKRILDFKNHIYKELKKNLHCQTNHIEHLISNHVDKMAVIDSVQDVMKSVIETNSNKQVLTQASDLIVRGEACLEDEASFGKLTIKYPKVDCVEKMRVDVLLYELIGTVSILSKEIDIGPVIKANDPTPTDESDAVFIDGDATESPQPSNIALPLILTQSCPTVDQLASPTDVSASETFSSVDQLSSPGVLTAAASDIDLLSEAEEAQESRLPFPSPKRHEHARVQGEESESQSTTCDDDSDSSPEERVGPKLDPPSGPFYVEDKTKNPDKEEFWLPQAKREEKAKVHMFKSRAPPSPPSPWKQTNYARLNPSRLELSRSSSPTNSNPPPSPPPRLMARKIKPFIKKWKMRQNSSAQ